MKYSHGPSGSTPISITCPYENVCFRESSPSFFDFLRMIFWESTNHRPILAGDNNYEMRPFTLIYQWILLCCDDSCFAWFLVRNAFAKVAYLLVLFRAAVFVLLLWKFKSALDIQSQRIIGHSFVFVVKSHLLVISVTIVVLSSYLLWTFWSCNGCTPECQNDATPFPQTLLSSTKCSALASSMRWL